MGILGKRRSALFERAALQHIPILTMVFALFFCGGQAAFQFMPRGEAQHASAAQYVVDAAPADGLLPDLVLAPPSDLKLSQNGDRMLLMFSTTYFNQGAAPVELIADPKTAGIQEDLERDVFQRVFREDGSSQDRVIGTFMWHNEHLHYHFADFANYDLSAVAASPHEDLSGSYSKATFCVRDVSRVLSMTDETDEADYLICGKERQGISVGWGDTYFFDYPDQNLNVTGLASGTYRLAFSVNPSRRIEESNYDNNTSSVLVFLDMEEGVVLVLDEYPRDTPEIEHVHLEQPFGKVPR